MKYAMTAGFALFLLVLLNTATAAEQCVNASYRTWSEASTIYINGSFAGSTLENGTEECPYGCLYGSCVPVAENGMAALALAILFGSVVLGFIYLGLKISGPGRVLSWLFIPVAVALVTVALLIQANTGAHIPANSNILIGLSFAFIIIVVLLIAIMYILLVRGGLKSVLPYSRKLKPMEA